MDQFRQLVVVMEEVERLLDLVELEVLVDRGEEVVLHHPQEVQDLQCRGKVMLVELVVLVVAMMLVLAVVVLGVEDLMDLHLVLEGLVEMVFH